MIQAALSTSLLSLLMLAAGFGLCLRWRISFAVFFLPLAVLVIAGCLVNLTQSPFYIPNDGALYEAQASEVARWLQDGMQGELELHKFKEFWPLMLGFAYFILGVNPLLGIIINAALVSLVILILIRTAQLIANRSPNYSVLLLVLINPMVLTMGPSLGREAIFWLGAALLSAAGVYFLKRHLFGGFVSFSVGAALLILNRPTLGLVVLFAFLFPIVALLIFQYVRGVFARSAALLIATCLLSVSVPFAFAPFTSYVENVSYTRGELYETAETGFGAQNEPPSSDRAFERGVDDEVGNVSTSRADSTVQGQTSSDNSTTTDGGIDISGVIENVRLGLVSAPNVLFGPFPYEIRPSATWFYLITSTGAWLFIVFLAIYEIVRGSRDRFKFFAFQLVVVGAYLFVLSVTLTNYGIVARFRVVAEIFLIPWAALTLAYRFVPWTKRRLQIRVGQ